MPLASVKYDDEHPDLDYGETLGWVKGVPACSNVDDGYFSGESHYVGGMYSGYRFQCVEYARRFLLISKGVTFDECVRASEIFDKSEVSDVETGAKHPLVGCANGESTRRPQVGDLIIYPFVEDVLPWGHVAVISAVEDDWVGIAEQNQENKSWGDKPYGRKCDLKQDADTKAYTIVERLPDSAIRPCRGWMQVEGKADRVTVGGSGHKVEYAPLEVIDEFKTKRGHPAWTRWDMPRVAGDAEQCGSKAAADVLATMPSRAELETPAPGECWPGPVKEFQSVYEPTEVAGVLMIPGNNYSFRLAGEAHKSLTASMSDEQISKRYAVPARYVPAARRQLSDFRHGSLIGALALTLNETTETYQLAEARLDSMEGYADLALGEAFANANGQPYGWKMTTSNENIGRAVRLVAQRKHFLEHRTAEVNTTVYFLDLPEESAELPLKDNVSTDALLRARRERANMRFVFEQYTQYLAEKAACVEKGELAAADGPVYDVQWVSLFDEGVSVDAKDGLTIDGRKADFVWKTLPWNVLFELEGSGAAGKAGGNAAKFTHFMDYVAADTHVVPTVFQPLWAHMLSAKGAARDASVWIRSDCAPAALKELLEPHAAPIEAFDSATGVYTAPLTKPHKDGPMKKRFRAAHLPEEGTDDVFIAARGFVADGLNAVGTIIEARRRAGAAPDARAPTLSDATHSAVMAFNLMRQDFSKDDDDDDVVVEEGAEAAKSADE
jgi:hypothetical protein